jgi:hypothetical protein
MAIADALDRRNVKIIEAEPAVTMRQEVAKGL